MKRSLILEILSFLFILLFVYAAFNKILDYQKFKIQVGQSPLLAGLGEFIPPMVILVELAVSILFVFSRTRSLAFLLSFMLMVMFTAYIVAILKFSPYVPCSCGGILETLGWTEHLLFNSAFIILGVVGIILQWKTEGILGSSDTSQS